MTNKFLDIAIESAQKAGKLILNLFHKDIKIMTKLDQSILTEADLKADSLIKNIIHKNFPSHDIFSEETGRENKSSDYLWLIDPLDGTTNFSVHNPFFAVSISLLQKNEPLLGVVYSPFLDELFIAETNRGAYLDNQPITINKKASIESSLLAYSNGRDIYSRKQMIRIFEKLKIRNNKVRQVGAVALELCYVASGRFGAFIMPGMNSWDVFAGALIVKEAGGIVTDFQNNSLTLTSSDMIACSPSIHPILLNIINSAKND
ncbi:MAG: inositol monophosphatase family protein [Candidatus Thorarchaeota archaeon]